MSSSGDAALRVLLIGGYGQLGTEIRRLWTGDDIVAPEHAALDFESRDALANAVDEHKPNVVVNCAAFHNVDRCEETPERAFAVNAVAVDAAARLCKERDVAFVTVSTDYVFDGTATQPYVETDVPAPISAYGVSKLAGELLVERLQSQALVVRTCGVYGVRPSSTKGYTFVDRVIEQARSGQNVRIVNDVFASPTFAGHLAAAMRHLVGLRARGLYHAANVGAVSWYEFANEVLSQAGIDHPVEPISAGEWKMTARRPAYSALDNPKLRESGYVMPTWREGIAAYLKLRPEPSLH